MFVVDTNLLPATIKRLTDDDPLPPGLEGLPLEIFVLVPLMCMGLLDARPASSAGTALEYRLTALFHRLFHFDLDAPVPGKALN